MTLTIGTRGSALAMAQAGDIARRITEASGVPTELVPVTTLGDVTRESLASLGGTGVFASALREFLLAEQCDLVVHSMKDLPTSPYAGLRVGAVPARADARDTLCARDGMRLADLPAGALVGTGSPRRAAQVLSMRPDVQVTDIRGNVDTRLRFVSEGKLDAVVLAAAGLERLGRTEAITEYFELSAWPCAPAQGALAIEVRAAQGEEGSDCVLQDALTAIHDPEAELATTAERAVLATLEAGCAAPIGAYAQLVGDTMTLQAGVYAPDGRTQLRRESRTRLRSHLVADRIQEAERAGVRMAEELVASGAARIAPLT